MFVQVIRGKSGDVESARRLMDRWTEELRPGATGYLGTTAGVTKDGEMIALARFESADAAKANSDRPEQGQWWAEMEKSYAGRVTFKDSSDVDIILGGGSDAAGFVQIMAGRAGDRAKAKALEARAEQEIKAIRPDVLGGLIAWHDDGTFTEAIYFTSEAAARDGEKGEMPAVIKELETVMPVTEFLDLPDPWLS